MWWVGAIVVAQVATSTPTVLERFAGSQAVVQLSTTVATLAPDLQLTYDPFVETSVVLVPRFAITKDWSVSAQLALAVEWTNSNTTDLRNEVEVSDLSLSTRWRGLPTVLGVRTVLGLDVLLPLAEATRASTLVAAPALSAAWVRTFELPSGELAASASALYRRPLYRYTTPEVDVPRTYLPQCFGGSVGCADQLSGVANVRDLFTWGLELEGKWGDFSPGVAWRMTHIVPYAFSEAAGVARLDDPARLRVSTYFAAWLDYDLTREVKVGVGYQLSRNVLGEDGQVGNPLFDRYRDMRLYLDVAYTFGGPSLDR